MNTDEHRWDSALRANRFTRLNRAALHGRRREIGLDVCLPSLLILSSVFICVHLWLRLLLERPRQELRDAVGICVAIQGVGARV